MLGHFGFSYIGLLFLILLFVPDICWTRKKPKGYTSQNEGKVLGMFEKTGQVLTTSFVLVFDDFNIHGWSNWSWWLIAACACMVMYKLWWLRYFRSRQEQEDFYSSFLGIPLAGATLPVFAFLFLGIYGKVIWLIGATVILGVGHIGIHIQYKRELTMAC